MLIIPFLQRLALILLVTTSRTPAARLVRFEKTKGTIGRHSCTIRHCDRSLEKVIDAGMTVCYLGRGNSSANITREHSQTSLYPHRWSKHQEHCANYIASGCAVGQTGCSMPRTAPRLISAVAHRGYRPTIIHYLASTGSAQCRQLHVERRLRRGHERGA